MNRRLITISIPVYNEAGNVDRLLSRLSAFAATEPKYDFEFLFTDNASKDETFEKLAEAAGRDPRIRVLRFSRNFGFQRSILANYLEARGDAAIQIDADLQDPPEIMSQFLRKWEEGYKVVYGIRRKRQESPLSNGIRKLGYWALHRLSEVDLPRDAGDFRLIDRLIIEHLRQIGDRTPFLRGLIATIGYPQTGILYDRDKRVAGESKFRFWALMRIGFDGICSQSTKLLQLITVFSVFIMVATLLIAAGYLVFYLVSESSPPPGFMTTVILQLLTIAINALFLGIMGEYIGRTYNNVRGLPLTIVERRIEPLNPQRQEPPAIGAGTRTEA
jgi:dolichol-phosphate mannosyltransferase